MDRGDFERVWGNCGPGCPIEADGWMEEDATFRVKYNDDETWKMTAVLTYILIISSLLLVGLFGGLILTFFGKLILKKHKNQS